MIRLIESAINKFDMISAGDTVLCGLSGGADSVAMTVALLELSKKRNFKICAAHLNHQLRGKEADDDELFVLRLCKKLNIPIISEKISASEYAQKNKLGIEEGARALRYDFFEKTAEKLGANKIATAHTADDNLETVLFNLIRGSALDGLCGIPPIRGQIIRPLIFCSRDDIVKFLETKNICFRTDSSNLSDEYTRNKIRHNIVPIVREINPSAAKTVAFNCCTMRNDAAFLEQLASDYFNKFVLFENGKISIKASDFTELSFSVQSRIVTKMLAKLAPRKNIGLRHIEAVCALPRCERGCGNLDLPYGISASFRKNLLTLEKKTAEKLQSITPVRLAVPGITSIPEINLAVECKFVVNNQNISKNTNTFYLNCDIINSPLFLRSREIGDKITLPERNITKTLKKLMNELDIPPEKRNFIPVISHGNDIVAVCGIGCNKKFLETRINVKCLRITIRSVRE